MTNETMVDGTDRQLQKTFQGSSAVSSAAFDRVLGLLTVTFTSGTTYQFHGVSEELVREWFAAPSAGSFFHLFIKKFRSERVA